jgi:hypothetical protein
MIEDGVIDKYGFRTAITRVSWYVAIDGNWIKKPFQSEAEALEYAKNVANRVIDSAKP